VVDRQGENVGKIHELVIDAEDRRCGQGEAEERSRV
jgi:hypothetical protein